MCESPDDPPKKKAEDFGNATDELPEKQNPDSDQSGVVLPCKNHWFGIRVKDEDGKPVRDIKVQVKLSDGSVNASVPLDEKGEFETPKNLPEGECEVSFPETYNLEWWPEGGSEGSFKVNQQAAIGDGDCLLSIAHTLGFRDYQSIWKRSKNKDLKNECPNPNQIHGAKQKTVHAPDQKDKIDKKAVDKTWPYVVKTKKPVKLRIVLVDREAKPWPGKDWEITAPVNKKGTTANDGLIEVEIPADAKAGKLKVTLKPVPPGPGPVLPVPAYDPMKYPQAIKADDFNDPAPAAADAELDEAEWDLSIGSLMAFDRNRGVHARLRNLGFPCEVVAVDDETKKSVKAYQRHLMKLKKAQSTGLNKDIQDPLRDLHDKP